MKTLKVAYICHVSNPLIRKNLKLSNLYFNNLIRKILGKKQIQYRDHSIWNTLCFQEFERIEDIEIHAIIPHIGMKKKYQEFTVNNIHYHCFHQQSNFIEKIFNHSNDLKDCYHYNRRQILKIIDKIEPDIINIIGAEGAFYSLSGLDINTEQYPLILTMQTALSDPDFIKMYPMEIHTYEQLVSIEQELFKKVQYVATDASWYREIAHRYNPSLKTVRFHICTNMTFNINKTVPKKYDFVYYAANINKAGDDAILAFAEAYKKNNSITINMVGYCSPTYREHINKLLATKNVNPQNVIISGYYPSHQEALQQVMYSRFALVPIKIDIISSTVREAMALGLPVITYRTKGTPALNKKMNCVLLSNIGDYNDMANNMIKLVENPELSQSLQSNALSFAQENWNTTSNMRLLADTYHAVYNNFHNKIMIPEKISNALY